MMRQPSAPRMQRGAAFFPKALAFCADLRYNGQDRAKEDDPVRMLLKGGLVYEHGSFSPMDIEVTDGVVTARGASLFPSGGTEQVFPLNGLFVFPGFADVHVHLREPGFSIRKPLPPAPVPAPGAATPPCAPCPI